jgi:hypothetical protein
VNPGPERPSLTLVTPFAKAFKPFRTNEASLTYPHFAYKVTPLFFPRQNLLSLDQTIPARQLVCRPD